VELSGRRLGVACGGTRFVGTAASICVTGVDPNRDACEMNRAGRAAAVLSSRTAGGVSFLALSLNLLIEERFDKPPARRSGTSRRQLRRVPIEVRPYPIVVVVQPQEFS